MKPSDKQDAQDIVERLEVGRGSRADVVALLMYLREELDNNDVLKDIAHCIAHTERDRGAAYTYIESFVRHFVDIVRNGGLLNVESVFPIEDVLTSLERNLRELGVHLDPAAIRRNADSLRLLLIDILRDTEVLLRNSEVRTCKMDKIDDHGRTGLVFVVYFNQEISGLLTLPTNVGFAFPALK